MTAIGADMADVGTSKNPRFPRKGSMASLFSRKPSSSNITTEKPKGSRSSFFQNFKPKTSSATLPGEKENERAAAEKPNHPAYGIPGEDIPVFSQSSRISALGNRTSIAGLVDLDQEHKPGWQPLFGSNVEDEVPDVDEGPSAFEPEVPKNKGKGKSRLYTDESLENNIQNSIESINKLPEGLPHAYQIIAGRDARKCPQYNCSNLYNGFPVGELWNDKGDTLVYLCPKNMTTPHGPSFLVDSIILQSTSDYWVTTFSPVWQGGFEIDKLTYPTAKFALFFAADRPDGRNEETDPLTLLRHYITIRNVFACIFDSFCVGLIEEDSPLLSDLVDRMLMYFDGSEDSLGEKLSEFIKKSGLWDVSNDPVKAVDLLHLAATYEMEDLYLEAFAHSVGMWPQVLASKAHEALPEPVITILTSRHKRLTNKIDVFSQNMKGFHFKELWTVNSPATKLPSTVRKGYESMRTFLYKYYTTAGFPKWPPKDLTTRPVVLSIYSDFCALYQLLVDRQYTSSGACACYPSLINYVLALYHIDQAVCKRDVSMPYGIPILPGYFAQTLTEGDQLRRPEAYRVDMEQKLKPEELDSVLEKMYNENQIANAQSESAESITTAFIAFEKSMMKGKTYKGIAEMRKGFWLLVYGALNVMAELSVEVDVVFKDEVDYLLCADTKGVFNWAGKRVKQDSHQNADLDDPDFDRWSLASHPGTQPDAQSPPAAAGSSATAAAPQTGAPGAGTKVRGKNRAEMSYPWVLAETPGWAIGTRQRGV
ncbi:hypothetical protein TWF225_006863 [Orbilia oligospora]|uniref:DUF8004 domain-containing protein n=1 Tax=Orbilia oligospora TaxID=2813651 RepID=A0A7C8PW29_ORBOL|nr:hypothetical protein TWF751_008400 [Orbilia oligospora]KAF3194313.1 hypothetical protein TWF225_006863 [Orbilia oligospora]KAF3233878.1 hypothetical protein TWF128_002839 [Orbilia oligospora]KAF3264064.1 hypothetical protein TWF217_003224 [Orbilia oligospora]TGJ68489.1 hypothetical protein EYR41_007536 [Orbilia oligospora]